MNLPVRRNSTEVRLDEDRGIFGVASVFYNPANRGTEYQLWKDTVERIDPAAFDRALADRDDVVALFNHDGSQLMGRTSAGTLELRKSEAGLEYRIPPNDTFWYQETAKQLRIGNVTGSSFAFWPEVEEWDETEELTVRTIKSVQLVDVGPVTWPAFKATTAGVRSEEQFAEARSRFEEWQARRKGREDERFVVCAKLDQDQAKAAAHAGLTRSKRYFLMD